MWRKSKYSDVVLLVIAEKLVVDMRNMVIQYQQTGFPWTPSLGDGVVYAGKPVVANFNIRPTLW